MKCEDTHEINENDTLNENREISESKEAMTFMKRTLLKVFELNATIEKE